MRGGHAAGLLGVLIFVTSGVSLLVYAIAALVSANQGAGASRTVGTACLRPGRDAAHRGGVCGAGPDLRRNFGRANAEPLICSGRRP
jgi:hypothetical protein